MAKPSGSWLHPALPPSVVLRAVHTRDRCAIAVCPTATNGTGGGDPTCGQRLKLGSGLSPIARLVLARTGVIPQVRSLLRCYSNSTIDRYVVAGCNNVHGCARTGAALAAPVRAHIRFHPHDHG